MQFVVTEVNMKIAALVMTLALSSGVQAQQCRVDIQNEVRLDGEQVEIYQTGSPKVMIDEDNNVFINGEKLDLDAMQREAVKQYREKMNEYLPKAKELAKDGLNMANDILDDVADTIGNSEAFDNVRKALEEFYRKQEEKHQEGEQYVLQEASFSEGAESWSEQFAEMKELFTDEFLSSAFDAVAESMKQEGGLNFTELKDQMVELKGKIEEKFSEDDIQEKAEDYCDSLDDMAEEEQSLQEKIPELKDYPVFLI
jgi:hypothetical protein